ncbi:hypothetical protein OKW39_002038 [Paraburkholderia sp. MM6662-R1]
MWHGNGRSGRGDGHARVRSGSIQSGRRISVPGFERLDDDDGPPGVRAGLDGWDLPLDDGVRRMRS